MYSEAHVSNRSKLDYIQQHSIQNFSLRGGKLTPLTPPLFSPFFFYCFPCPNSSVSFPISLYSRTCFPYRVIIAHQRLPDLWNKFSYLYPWVPSHIKFHSLPCFTHPHPRKRKNTLNFTCVAFLSILSVFMYLGEKSRFYYIQAYRELDDIKWQCKWMIPSQFN